jgi:hypothetical protein
VSILTPTVNEVYFAGVDFITLSGLANDDSRVASVVWTRTPDSYPASGNAAGTQSWTGFNIPLVKDPTQVVDNVITVTAIDPYGNIGSASITVKREKAIANEPGPAELALFKPAGDPLDLDGDGYVDEDETACGSNPLNAGSVPVNSFNSHYPTDKSNPYYRQDRVKKDSAGNVIGSYLWPDQLNLDDDQDGLPDEWEMKYFNTTTGANPGDDPDGDTFSNLEEYENGTDPTKPQAVGLSLTVMSTDFKSWLPTYQGVLKVQAAWTGGGTAPATVYFSLKDTSKYPGRAVNDPDPAITQTNYPSWYQYNGYDFGLTNDPANTQSYAQGPVAVTGNNGIYEIYLQSWDFGGRTRVVVGNQPSNPTYTAEIWVPNGSGKDGIGSGWPSRGVDPNGDIDEIVFEKPGNTAPQGDGFNNFEEYRGIVYTEGGALKHMRLDPKRKDLFVRAEGFTAEYPFAIGDALKNAGIDVHDTTAWGHDATQDGSFFTYYRGGTITTISGVNTNEVTGNGTAWQKIWPRHEWEFKLDTDGSGAWTPVGYWVDPAKLYLDLPYPGSAGGGTYTLRMPVPHINVLIVRHDAVAKGVLSWEDGHIWFQGASQPGGELYPNGARHWSWTTKGYSATNSTEEQPSMYGFAVTLEKPLKYYFEDKPYVDGTTWTAGGWPDQKKNPPDPPNPNGMLDPLSQVEDQEDTLSPVDGIMGDAANSVWDGDYRTTDESTWSNTNNLNPFDINHNGLVELPVATDPDEVNPADEYDLKQVLKHTITHEICHALAGDSHSSDPACVMYKWSVDWKRQDYLSDGYRSLLRVHNIKR